MLLSLEQVKPYLRCPVDGGELIFEQLEQKYSVPATGRSYNSVDGTPVLVDFSKSVLSKSFVMSAAEDSAIDRKHYTGFKHLIKRIVTGSHKKSAGNISKLVSLLEANAKSKVLVVGGGSIGEGLQELYDSSGVDLISFDIYKSPHVQFVADAHNIPLPSSSFDCVIIQAVIEHVLDPQIVVQEIHRVLKASGIVYAETPFMQQVHEGAYDFTRYTENGHRNLFKKFQLIDSGVLAGPGTTLLWAIDYFVTGVTRVRVFGKLSKLAFFWLRFFDDIIRSDYALDGASGVFFMGRKAEFSITPQCAIDNYKGAQQ